MRKSTETEAESCTKMNSSDYANHPSAGALSPGVMSNLDHSQILATEVHVAIGISMSLTFVFIVLRLYVKFAVTHMWNWDDC